MMREEALPTWRRRGPAPADPHPGAAPGEDWSVVAAVGGVHHDPARLTRSLDSLLAQGDHAWELVVVPVEGTAPDLPADARLRVLPAEPTRAAAWARGLRAAAHERVLFLVEGDRWHPDRIAGLRTALGAQSWEWAHDVLVRTEPDGARAYADRSVTSAALTAGRTVDLAALVVDREVALDVGGIDTGLPTAWGHDLAARLVVAATGVLVGQQGVDVDDRHDPADVPPARRPWLDHATFGAWHDVVTGRHLVDWAALRPADASGATVVIAVTDAEDRPALGSLVAAVLAEDGEVDVVLVDSRRDVGADLPAGDRVTVVPGPVPGTPALTLAAAGPVVRRRVLVRLAASAAPEPGWLPPLVDALDDDAVLAAQPLVLDADGRVQSAGAAFPRGGGLPHDFLTGEEASVAAGVADLPFRAVQGPAVAFRTADLVAAVGPDPIYGGDLADVDVCLRLGDLRRGRCTVRPEAVVRVSTVAGGRRTAADRRLLLERWSDRLPGDDHVLWAALGRRVVGHRPVQEEGGPRDRRLWLLAPVLASGAHEPTIVRQAPLRLTWAIKNPAPAGEVGETWGDTHFARQLAAALERRGQHVVVDHRPDFAREDAWRDDVVLVLRGRVRYAPVGDQVNLLWLISHPDLLAESEWRGYDRVYAASTTWAQDHAATGAPTATLLQCTDPSVFHPDLAAPDSGEPLLFVGNSRGVRRPLVDWAIEADLPLSIVGGNWDGLVPAERVRSTYLANDRVGAAYRAAGIVLNDHWDDMRVGGFLSNRLFDAVAAGARVVSDDVVGLREVFGSAVQVVSSARDLAALVAGPDRDRVFGTDAERRAQAATVHRLHSFDARAGTLLDDAVETIRRRGLGEGT